MRILFLTPELPHPARSGGTIKSATVLEYLNLRHDVDLMCIRRSELSEEQSSWAGQLGTVVTVPLSRERTAANLLRSYAAGVPLSVLRNRSADFARLVLEQLAGRHHDAVFVDSWLMAQYLPRSFQGLKTLHQHNAEYVMWQRQAAFESNPVRRALVRRESQRVRRYESSILSAFDVVFAVSEPDRRALQDLGAGPGPVELLPNVPEPGMLDRPALAPGGADPVLLYLATLSWQPNLQGLHRFLRTAFPLLRDRLPRAKLVVAGQGAPPELARLAGRVAGVELVGAFDDPEPLYRQARAFIEVALGGSGTRLKVLNALARGLPVVTTPEGAEGLDIRPGEHALVGATPAEMVDSLVRVMSDDAVWAALAENGRRLVRERYRPETAYRILDRVFGADTS
jgi:glycosyltransferase involved in cell wall biosynthesis